MLPAYRAVEAGAVGKVARGAEFLAYDHGGPEEQRLAHGHSAASRVVKRQWGVEHIVVPEAQGVVYPSGYEEIAVATEY